MAKQRKISPDSGANGETGVATPFRRMLVAIDESPTAEAAIRLVAEWVDGPGADVRFVQVTEARRQPGSDAMPENDSKAAEASGRLVVGAPTLGARNRQLVRGIAEAAQGFGADVIVLGLARSRLAGHRFAASLREQLMRATDLPVLVAPSPQPNGKRHRGLAPDHYRDEERADTARRSVHV
jgi:nucleotide-binding universal stress UspA family protein